MSGITGCFGDFVSRLDCRDRLMVRFTADQVALATKVGKAALVIIACLTVGFVVGLR